MMPYYVGIDGGGTKTAVELRTRGSAAHSRAVFGPLNCNSDRPAAAKALADTLVWLAAQPEGLAGCDGLCIGSAGISNPDAYNFIQDIIRAGGYTGPLQIVGDQVTALAGALGQPVGTVLMKSDGYLWKKLEAEPKAGRNNWKQLHRIIWEEANGPIPDDCILVFRDQNRENCTLENLALVGRAVLGTMNRHGVKVTTQEGTDAKILIAKIRIAVKAKKRRKK